MESPSNLDVDLINVVMDDSIDLFYSYLETSISMVIANEILVH